MSDKRPTLEKLLHELAPHGRTEGKCAVCGKELDVKTEFRDEVSRKEYDISYMCQACQDRNFAEPEPEADAPPEPAF
jgi:hypothetical protein